MNLPLCKSFVASKPLLNDTADIVLRKCVICVTNSFEDTSEVLGPHVLCRADLALAPEPDQPGSFEVPAHSDLVVSFHNDEIVIDD